MTLNFRQKGKELLVKQPFKTVYYGLFILFVLIFTFAVLFTHGAAFKCIVFNDNSDTFMDHFNSVVYNENDPYELHVIYPPLACLCYKFCNRIIPRDDYYSIVTDPAIKAQPRNIRIGQSFQFQFIIYMLVTALLFLIALDLMKKGSKRERGLFLLTVIASAPLFFMLDRGNNMLIPLAFSMFFITYYDSENKILREFALFSLAIAVGFKIYPALFAVVLISEKRWKEFFRTVIYCIATTILPFFIFYKGVASLKLMVQSIIGFGEKRSDIMNMESQLDFKRSFAFLLKTIFAVLHIPPSEALFECLGSIYRSSITILAGIGALVSKKRWKQTMCCCAILYGWPGSCTNYLLSFFIISIILFLDEEKDRNVLNWLYLIGLLFTQVPLVIRRDQATLSRFWPTKVSSCAVSFLCCLVVFQMLVGFFKWNKKRREKHVPFITGITDEIVGFIMGLIKCGGDEE